MVLTFLESVGRPSEARLYLKLFRELPKESFAVVVADASGIVEASGSVVEQLRFLRHLGLYAPVVLGTFDPKDAERAADELERAADDMQPSRHGWRGEDTADAVRTELRCERLPIISMAAHVAADTAERFARVAELTSALGSRKIAVLRPRGGLGPHGGPALSLGPGHELATHDGGISVINLRTDFERLTENEILDDTDRELLTHLRTVLSTPGCDRTLASITSPLNLLRELFTTKGAGTLVKRGTAILTRASYDAVEVTRLRQLLESSFERSLATDFFDRAPAKIYVEENYRGAAIVVTASPAPFLTKFAVEKVAQGEGMARDLWHSVARDQPELFWRARNDNPIAAWYATLCDGLARSETWTVYWRGIPPARVPEVVESACARPDDFGPPEPS